LEIGGADKAMITGGNFLRLIRGVNRYPRALRVSARASSVPDVVRDPWAARS
jgi:hypothetical protein